MKKLILLTTMVGFAMFAKAQSTDFRAFKFDIGFGYAIPTASSNGGTKAGVTFTLQPHYRLSDEFAVGLRIEEAGLGYENGAGNTTDIKVAFLASYCVTGEYYLSNGSFRPFVGGGVGFFNQSSADVNSNTVDQNNNTVVLVPGGTKFGLFPEVGFEAGHFRLSADYNVAGGNNNYASFKVGFFFGGGRK
jgi:outer membrane protein W